MKAISFAFLWLTLWKILHCNFFIHENIYCIKLEKPRLRSGRQIFKNPPNKSGFGWEQIDKGWADWSIQQYRQALNHPLAIAGFESDFKAMRSSFDGIFSTIPSLIQQLKGLQKEYLAANLRL